ncbi:MAG: hypothetical protein KKA42_16150, partial [candidate division Zixibacteria bacterium]|nr:hypothetical protein [candidate division Zixibacteria bacterium]
MKKSRSGKRPVGIGTDDLFRLRLATSVAISPDETQMAYTVERMDKTDNTYYTNVFMCDLRSGESRPFTSGKQADRPPVWSHDGSRLAFVSTRDKKTGIYVMPVDGGAESLLLEIEGSISSLQWTPDDQELVFALQYADSHFITDEKKKKE